MQGSQRRITLIAAAAALLAVTGCGDDDGPSADDEQEAVEHYAAGVHAAYEASLASATELATALEAFVADPTEESLETAKQAWLTARGRLRPHRGVPLLRRADRQRGDRPGGSHQRLAARRGLRRLRRGRRQHGHRQRHGHLPDDRRRADLVAERAGRRGQHLDGLARHRVPPLGPGPLRRRPRRAAGDRLHGGAERRPPGHLPHRRLRPAHRRPHVDGRGVGSRQRQLPGDVRRAGAAARRWPRSSPASAS